LKESGKRYKAQGAGLKVKSRRGNNSHRVAIISFLVMFIRIKDIKIAMDTFVARFP